MPKNKAVEKRKAPAVVETINQPDFLAKVANVLPKMIKPQHFARVAVHALNRTPKLLDCTPVSVINCLLDLAQCGLEPDGRNAHLIPYGNTCQLIVDWKGMVELARRSGLISMWKADIIFENDVFTIDKGEVLAHTVDYHKSEERGKPLLVYSYVKYKDGTEDYDIMTMAEVEAIRGRSKAKDSGPWKTDKNEMIKKTVMRRHSKRLPQSPEMIAVLDLDLDTPDFDITPPPRADVVKPIDVEAEKLPPEDPPQGVDGDGQPNPPPAEPGNDGTVEEVEKEKEAQDGGPMAAQKKSEQKKGFKLEDVE